MVKKVFSIIILIIVIVLLSVGGYFVYKYLNRETPAGSTPSEIEGWQTYTNTEYGFEFQYPADWFLDDESREGKEAYLFVQNMEETLEDPNTLKAGACIIYTLVNSEKTYSNIEDLILSMPDSGSASERLLIIQAGIRQFEIGGEIFQNVYFPYPNYSKYISQNLMYFITRNKSVMINFYCSSPSIELENKHVFNDFLSTFKFVK